MQVQLFKKNSTYTDKNGEKKTATNFYVQCGDTLIPVEVRYFEDKNTGNDYNYRGRKLVLSSFADLLPEKQSSDKKDESHLSDKAADVDSNADLPF